MRSLSSRHLGLRLVGFAIAFTHGFTSLLGFKLNPVTNAAFEAIRIGVDDMFV